MRPALLLALAVALLAAPPAGAHPLGNFSVNHLAEVGVSKDAVDVLYVLDQAEIPTVEERGLSRAELLRRKRREVARALELRVDGSPVALTERDARLSFPPGQGGLRTTRLELRLRVPVDAPRRVEIRDGTFPGRVGWKAVVSRPGEGTAVRSDAPSGDPTGRLRRYPENLLESPAERRSASFSVRPGEGTLAAPRGEDGGVTTTRRGSDGFSGLFEDAASGEGVLLVLLLAAFGWGALHALSPGHGKAMVAAYLVGTRGSSRHALALGGTVTVTHTIGVFALGAVTLALSQYVLPEDLYPWLTLVSGLMVVAIGAGVLRSRVRQARAAREHDHDHGHSHSHSHGHGHGHGHHHHHHDLSWKGLLGMGTAAGLIPCPSALVVLLAAVSQHEVALGMLLILAFSLGLAGTLVVLGLAVVHAGRFVPPRFAGGRLVAVLPAASALVIVAVGCLLTARAVPNVL
jgi:ABC-type nickel/cobalt efflux system permease component RcnA